MRFQSFREIIAWQKARILVNRIYSDFRNNKDFGFRNQIQRASVSILANIAEGYGRNTNNEFIRFLEISKGSAYEVQSLLDIAYDLKYISNEEHTKLDSMIEEIVKITYGLVQTLQIIKSKTKEKNTLLS